MSEITKQDGMTIFKTDSRIDTAGAARFESELMPLLTEGGMTLVLDCADLTYMASSGLRVIQKAMRTLVPYKGEVKLINVSPAIYEVLEMTGFPQFMKIEKIKR